jgi:heptosyltransferase-2
MKSILIIQTAFIGDVILATAIIEELKDTFPESEIDFLLRNGNETLLDNNPHINQVLIWDKTIEKKKNLFKALRTIRTNKYDLVINLQRFLSTGVLTAFSGAKTKVGFKKNPLSYLFSRSYDHIIDPFVEMHEVERNLKLISKYSNKMIVRPKLYPSEKDYEKVKEYKTGDYICIAPTSVWFTKQFPGEKWIEFIQKLPNKINIYLLGSKSDHEFCEKLISKTTMDQLKNLAGELSFLESAALMKNAVMNYTNDSAPLHIASAMNAHIAAIFCSTVPGFGFGPLSDNSHIIEIEEKLDCRPCGLHGKTECPEKHFKCGFEIEIEKMLKCLD